MGLPCVPKRPVVEIGRDCGRMRSAAAGKAHGMDEIYPGLYTWSAVRETIGQPVHSAYVAEARTLIDPMEPPEGLGAFGGDGLPAPERIVLTGRHHRRHSERFVERFGCSVHAHEAGLHDLADAPMQVHGFKAGDELAPGVVAQQVGVLCPDESAVHIAHGPGALAVADGVIRFDDDEGLAFVPDHLLGDEPERVKTGLARAYLKLCDELEFDTLLLAHGAPVAGTGDGRGRAALRAFAEAVLRR